MSEQPRRVGIIGGSGLGQALTERMDGQSHQLETPFGKPSGPIVTGELEGVPVAFLARHGVGHVYNPSLVPYRANIYALKMLGVTHIIASGATGSLVEMISPRDLVICDQVIDKTNRRVNTFFDEPGMVVHVDFAYPFSEKLRRLLIDASDDLRGITVHPYGTYVCMEGPQFSTRAESLWHRQIGGHVIGMTAMPEARLAREAEIAYALVALPTDYDCWRPHGGDVDGHQLINEIIGNLHSATENTIKLITTVIPSVGALLARPCELEGSVKMGVWTDKKVIPAALKERYRLLTGELDS